jgi:hypothetical protein
MTTPPVDGIAPQDPDVDFLILADRAEVIGNKLYMMGGGWDQVMLPSVQVPIFIGIGIALRVPWHATNRAHNWSLSVQSQDAEVLMQVNAEFTAGRPSGITAGADQRVMFAIPSTPVSIPAAGTYVIIASINGEEKRRISFQVTLAPNPPQVQVGGEPPPQ